MFRNYIKIFFRLFIKQTVFTLINIVGLAVGLACCLLISVYVLHEFSYDRFYTNAENLYRVGTSTTQVDGTREEAMTYKPVASLLTDNFPEITATARMRGVITPLRKGDDVFIENEFKLADPEFFSMFDFIWIEGDRDTALSGATDAIVTRSFAQRYFGDGSALGRTVLLAESDDLALRVTGVVEDLPRNTHLSGNVFAPLVLMERLRPTQRDQWSNTSVYTYLTLRSDVNAGQFQQQLEAFARANIPQTENTGISLTLKPITSIHLNYTLGDWISASPPGSKSSIAMFSAIGLGILLIACANFVNLSTARSAQRFQEVGLRLTLGARRSQLLVQFLGESVLFVLLAIVLALALVELLLPVVQALLGLTLAFDSLTDAMPIPALLAAGVLLGLLAGWYPALLLSGYKPVTALRDISRSQVRGLALKNILVVFQFAIAITMLIASVVIYLQMVFVSDLDLGYDGDQVMIIQAGENGEILKERLLQNSIVSSAALSSSYAGSAGRPTLVNAEGSNEQHRLGWFEIGFDYFTVYDIPLLNGRFLSEEISGDRIRPVGQDNDRVSGNVMLSTSGASELGWSEEEAVGKHLLTDNARYQVIGIVGDTYSSAYAGARPMIYTVPENPASLYIVVVKFEGVAPIQFKEFVENTWKDIIIDEPMTSTFQSELLASRYQRDLRLQTLIFLFTGMAVVISCMGLFGLANFSTHKRIKEIGVRKVMGGSVWDIMLLLTNDFSKLVLVSNVIAWPVAYFAMSHWLENFAYRIDLTPLIFIGSGLVALCIAWVTVGGTAAKAASQKPVLALRYE